ncbi:Rne/Rng family ribonuclease [Glaciihabitans sp. dw_435]|uniref:Rne/Rng family ribonuclease n=1 Tax=Glaciihabitans sp. dw_435 TaxID=2720081 RepID=UPI001BD4420D|nr:Rne/Rng family ribonuclease [Glaciihabitans sp. dw_435]
MVNTNENNEAPKKRSRLFGGRKAAAAAAEAAAAAQVAETPAPVAEAPIEAPVVEASAPEPAAPVQDAPAATAPRRRAPAKQTSTEAPADADAPTKAPVRRSAPRKTTETAEVAPALTTNDSIDAPPARRTPPRPSTSLLFQAPDLPPMRETARDDRRDWSRDDQNLDAPRRGDNRRDNQRADSQRGDDARSDFRRDDLQDDEPQGVRRRSRRRPGEEPRAGDTDPNTVVKVRQPRQQPEPELITEPQRIKGSTRLEAKKQRRRDGRDAGRRRPVITEAEFLARRESVDRVMVVRSKFDKTQIAVLEDGVLVEHYVAKAAEASLIGNVYLGRVQNVLPSMEAAFVDIGRGRNAVLYSGEVDWDAAAADSDTKNQPRRIELALKPGDRVLVQVTKDPIGHKGARLTSQVSLPGRYLVYVPNGSMNGISRKLPDTERARLKKILKEVLPENVGVIVRTASEGATEEQLTLDVNRLTSQWAEISRLVETSQAPVLLHSEPDLLVKIVRDVFNEDFQKLVIAGPEAQGTIETYLRSVAPDLLERVETYEGDTDSFDAYRVTEQIEKALDRKVWLPSGGSLVIDRTEAMTVVDVNTGKFVGSGGNLEETVTKNNLEAAEEIVRQLRLRDIGGIIVVDFIDMVLESNRDLVLRRLVECLSRDRTKHQVAEVTSLGLVQMTRKKLGLGLIESFSEPCEHCAGRGIIIHHDPTTKHRQTPQQQPEGTGRRGRGSKGPATTPPSNGQRGNGNSNGNSNGNGNNNGAAATVPVGAAAPVVPATHAITEDARKALSKIAASTVHTEQVAIIPPSTEVVAAAVEEVVAKEAAQAAPAETAPTGRTTSGRQSGRGQRAERTPVEASEEPSTPAVDVPVAILDIPVTKSTRASRRISTHDAEQILDSVLDALPEPKQPGQGRSRTSRRASSTGAGIITTDAAKE